MRKALRKKANNDPTFNPLAMAGEKMDVVFLVQRGEYSQSRTLFNLSIHIIVFSI